MLKEFKAFLMRGNVVDLAVAVVLGAAFGAVITAFVDGIITPILGLFGEKDFSDYVITLKENDDGNDITLKWGQVLTAVINFVLIAAAIFFVVIKPITAALERRRRGEEPIEDTPVASDEAVLLTEIRDLLRSRG